MVLQKPKTTAGAMWGQHSETPHAPKSPKIGDLSPASRKVRCGRSRQVAEAGTSLSPPEAGRSDSGGLGRRLALTPGASGNAANFGGLVLGCIGSQLFQVNTAVTRSARCTYFCTGPTSKFQRRSRPTCFKMKLMNIPFSKLRVFQNVFATIFAIFTFKLDEIVSKFRDTLQTMQKYIEICRNCAKYYA